MNPSDIEKTAVTTPFSLFEYKFMPFGLRNSAATFQRFMDSIFRDLDFVFVYLDDLLIYSDTPQEHEKHLEEVFKRLDKHSLKISVDKCKFHESTIDFLGFQISKNGIEPPTSKKTAMKEFPLPCDSKALRRFLGMINFYRTLIPQFADIVYPISELAKFYPKAQSLPWNEEATSAFNKIKEKICEITALQCTSPNSSVFQLVTDSSQHAVGAALHQMINNTPVPVGFFSKKIIRSTKEIFNLRS